MQNFRRVSAVGLAALFVCAVGMAATPFWARWSTSGALVGPGDTVVVYGAHRFATPTGSSTVGVESFTLSPQDERRYLVKLANGNANGSGRASTASVVLNGHTVITATDVGAATSAVRVVHALPNDTLAVTVAGNAGAFVDVSILEVTDPTFVVYGPTTFVRGQGQPLTEAIEFDVSATAGAPFYMSVRNGRVDGTLRTSSATIVLNGQTVVSSNELSQQVGGFVRQVTLQAHNTLTATVASVPSSEITITFSATDVTAPVLTIATPAQNLITRNATVAVTGTVSDETPTTVTVNDSVATRSGDNYSANATLNEGSNTILVRAVDAAGNQTDSTRTVIRDTQAPALIVDAPPSGFVTKFDTIYVRGTVADLHAVTVSANGVPLPVDGNGVFNGSISLVDGTNFITIVATDAAGNTTTILRSGTRDVIVPVLTVNEPADGFTTTAEQVTVAGTVTDATAVTLTVNGTTVTVASNGSFTTTAPVALGPNTITVIATDAATNATTVTRSGTRNEAGPQLPPDPATVAPPINRTAATTLAASTSFLYTGDNPIQTGVAAGTIQPYQVAIVRGKVIARDGAALSGVTVSVLSHPELGQTLSRVDGRYDLAVNGGGPLTLEFRKTGYLGSQRLMTTQRQEWAEAEAVALVPLDPIATPVNLNAEAPVARGSVQTDASGSRQSTMIFEQGTQASMTLADGTIQPLTSLTVRATEYTVGPNGPKAMPAPLPPSSAYTYAAELTVDEALAAGATRVEFSKPVAVYVENFIGFPVGGIVPLASYDRSKGAWVPEKNGRIIKVLSTDGGIATLDIDGSGTPANETALATLGVTSAELPRLAALYQPGQSLWRYELSHFTPHDPNWLSPNDRGKLTPSQKSPKSGGASGGGGSGSQDGSPDAGGGGGGGGDKAGSAKKNDEQCEAAGSIIGCERRTLGEAIPVAGTGMSLVYSSDRTPGYSENSNFDVALSDDLTPDLLSKMTAIYLRVSVAGHVTIDTFPAQANLHKVVTWAGKDAYGRTVQGQQRMVVMVGYAYTLPYGAPLQTESSFGLASGTSMAQETRVPVEFWQTVLDRPVGNWDNRAAGLGGWTLSAHHSYDPSSAVLYLGTGEQRSAANLNPAFVGVPGSMNPDDLVTLPDGGVIYWDNDVRKLMKIDRLGNKTVFAGNGSTAYSGDGGPAINAGMSPARLARGPDGTIYFSDNVAIRFRKITPDGIITSFFGIGGTAGIGDSGDDGPALQAKFTGLLIAVAPDGSVYTQQPNSVPPSFNRRGYRIRRIGTDGIVKTIAGVYDGTCTFGPSFPALPACQEDVPAFGTPIEAIGGLKMHPDGTLYFYSNGSFQTFWTIDAGGLLKRIAGRTSYVNNTTVQDGDGGPARDAGIRGASGRFAVGPDHSVYFHSSGSNTGGLRRVTPDGIINMIAGGAPITCGTGGIVPPCPSSTNAQNAPITGSPSIAVDEQNVLYIADFARRRILKMIKPLPGFEQTDLIIASSDGAEVYRFDSYGRHAQTLEARTGAVLLSFSYDAQGLLSRIEDTESNVTIVERDVTGTATAIVSPYGLRTKFTSHPDGYLASVRAPGGETSTLAYYAAGLLSTFREPSTAEHRFTYDDQGHLVSDENPAGARSTLNVSNSQGVSQTTVTTIMGRTTTTRTEQLAGAIRTTGIEPSGIATVTTVSANDSSSTRTPDGTIISSVLTPDPRFGAQASFNRTAAVKLPVSAQISVTRTVRRVTMADAANPFSLTTQLDSLSENGQWTVVTYDAATRRITTKSPTGRQAVAVYDPLGRLLQSSVGSLLPKTFTYDSRGHVERVRDGGRERQYTSDEFGRAATITNALGITSSFAYDSVGRLTRFVQPGNRVTAFAYDAAGRLASVTPPGKPAHMFSYTTDNRLERYTAPAVGGSPYVTRYEYNLDRQLTKTIRPDNSTIEMDHDPAGRLSSVAFAGGLTTFSYSGTTGLLQTATRDDRVVTLAFDGRLPTATTWSGPITGTVSRTFNPDFRVSAVGVNGSLIPQTYDQDGLQLTAGSMTYAYRTSDPLIATATQNGIVGAWSYTDRGEVSKYSVVGADTLFRTSYSHDSLGRISSSSERIGTDQTPIEFSYDSLGRLEGVRRNASPAAAYTYDDNGNRLSVTTPNGIISGTYDNQDRLIAYGDETYSYAPNGTLSWIARLGLTTRFEHDGLGHLTAVVLPNDTRIDYVLDAMNRRIGVKRNGVLVKGYLYNEGPKPIAELDAASTVVARFVYGVRGAVPEYLIKAGQTYRIISDHLGSVRLVVDANGSTVQRIDYDEYGQITQNTNPGFQPFGFAGGLVDDGTRLVQFGARNYDPYVGRWISQDPIRFAGMSANLYSYAGGDPINVSDPTGMCAEDCKTNPALVPLDTKALKVQFSSDAMNLFSPEMASILTQQISALNKQSITPVITDGYRTEATQWSRRQNNSAAAQGTSLHQTGNAVDFGPNSNGSNFDDISDAMDKSGLRIGRKFETPDPVHWDRNPYSTQDERDSAAQRAEDFFWNCVLGLGTKPTIK